jgi:hypothetical protein
MIHTDGTPTIAMKAGDVPTYSPATQALFDLVTSLDPATHRVTVGDLLVDLVATMPADVAVLTVSAADAARIAVAFLDGLEAALNA